MIDLDAIRARDAEFSAEHMHTMTYGVQDRRALLAYVDELQAERALIVQRAENAEAALAQWEYSAKYDDVHYDALRARLAALEAAAQRAERKLSAYVGVCAGDKELTDTILPMIRAALVDATHQPPQKINAFEARLAEAEALLTEIAGHRPAVAFFAPQLAGVIGTLNRIDAHLARQP